jgi:hypothetical protein
MPRIRSMVVLLDDGTYRTIDVARLRSAYVHGLPPEHAVLHSGDGGLVSPPAKAPEWDWFDGKAAAGASVEPAAEETQTRGGNGDPPVCFYVDGTWICI